MRDGDKPREGYNEEERYMERPAFFLSLYRDEFMVAAHAVQLDEPGVQSCGALRVLSTGWL